MEKQKEKAIVRKNLVSNGKGLVLGSVDDMWRFAEIMVAGGLAPRGLETPQKLMIAIEHGQEYGIPAIQAIKCTKVINGVPSFYGEMPLALVRRENNLEYIREKWEGEGDALTATCETKRKDSPDSVTRTFSVADAKKAKLWEKAGPWSNYPKRMLQMRARSWCLNDNFPEVLMGMTIAEEYEGVDITVYNPENMPQTKVREDRTEEDPDTRTLDMAMRELRATFVDRVLDVWPDGKGKDEIINTALMDFAAFMHGGKLTDYAVPPKNWTMQKCDDLIGILNERGIPQEIIEGHIPPFMPKKAEPKVKPKPTTKQETPPEPDPTEPPIPEMEGEMF